MLEIGKQGAKATEPDRHAPRRREERRPPHPPDDPARAPEDREGPVRQLRGQARRRHQGRRGQDDARRSQPRDDDAAQLLRVTPKPFNVFGTTKLMPAPAPAKPAPPLSLSLRQAYGSFDEHHEEGRDDGVGGRDRQQHLPAEPHQLVVAEARLRRLQPDEDARREKKSFSMNQNGPNLSSDGDPRKWSPSRNNVTRDPRTSQVDVLRRLEQAPAHAGVLGVVPAMSSVSASGRSNGGREVSAMPPIRNTTSPTICGMKNQSVACCLSTISRGSATAPSARRRARRAQRDLVGDELRARAHRAEDRVLRLGGPAADDEAVDADGAEREDEDQRDRHVRDRAWM